MRRANRKRRSQPAKMATSTELGPGQAHLVKGHRYISTAIALALLVAGAVFLTVLAPRAWQVLVENEAEEELLSYVGSETCATCHSTEADLWRSSQHKHAMDHATDTTVRGDFSNARLEYFGSYAGICVTRPIRRRCEPASR